MTMNFTCQDRDRILEDGTPAEWAELEAHGANCAVCANELRAWKALSVAAQQLRDYSDRPSLWPRIESALAAEAAAKKQRPERWGWLSLGFSLSLGWQTAVAAALVLVFEVERAQAAYEQAIDKLAAEAKPELENPATPVEASYREKLLVLDSAINDLRAQAGMNPSNAHLRQQLLAMYQEKQQTLQEILEEKR